jgi:hypothetical protein
VVSSVVTLLARFHLPNALVHLVHRNTTAVAVIPVMVSAVVGPNPSNSRTGPDQQQPHTTPIPDHGKEDSPKRLPLHAQRVAQPPAPQQKKLPRHSSKPIINWFQRKLAGTVRTKRANNAQQQPTDVGRGKGRGGPIPLRTTTRVASTPLPSPAISGGRQQGKLDALAAARRKTVSLNGDDDVREFSADTDEEDGASDLSESVWSPTTALEADEDASVRPIPPSAPPSPSPSRSSSSYLSDPRTFRSMAASTKPTTLLSIDLHGNGMAHIAQVPTIPTSQMNRLAPHIRTSSTTTNSGQVGSGASITFSALPPSPQSSSQPSSLHNPGSINSENPSSQPTSHIHGPVSSVQAPLHTTHHPRNNPRPSSPPLDNASVLTLASSAYAMPGLRASVGMPGWSSAPPSAKGAGDSLSHFGGSITYADAESTSQFVLGYDDRLEERDVDASVRALRPRSSRRGSWESEASRWSARIQMGTGTPSLARERSLWTTNSVRTGGFSGENVETYERSDEGAGIGSGNGNDSSDGQSHSESHASLRTTPSGPDPLDVDALRLMSPSVISDSEPTPKNAPQGGAAYIITLSPPSAPSLVERQHSSDTVARLPQKNGGSDVQARVEDVAQRDESQKDNGDAKILEKEDERAKPLKEHEAEGDQCLDAASATEKDVWHSAPSTPAPSTPLM